jgi:hypothetical protein
MAKSRKRRKIHPQRPEPAEVLDLEPEAGSPARAAFSGWPMIIGWLAMLIFAFHASTHMVAAGDTWVAMACGRHFVNHGVDTVEPFSANSHKPGPTPEEVKTWPKWAQRITEKVGLETVRKWHPTGWVNQNWLTHVIFYSLVPKSSYADGITFSSNALVYWKFAIYIITVICVYYTARLLGVNPALAAVFACFAMFIGRSFLDVRPAGFSNVLVAIMLLVLALATYRHFLYIWLIVPVTVFWCNVHGGYIYVFIMLVPFIALHLLAALGKIATAILYNIAAWPFLLIVFSKAGLTPETFLFALLLVALDFVLIFSKERLAIIPIKGILHAIGAYFATFLAVIIFNPFHLTNLTHTFVISVSKHAERWRDIHEWHPAFDWDNPVGTAVPFLVMYIIAWLLIAIWVTVLFLTATHTAKQTGRKTRILDEFKRPKIDLPLMLIAALTIYMAIRSRRFIPVAAIAACPIIAMFVDQIVRLLSAVDNLQKHRHLAVRPMPRHLQLSFTIFGAAAVLFFGTWWGLKFKRVYLDPWPNDPKFSSVFMRMTASDAKPFYALRFIKDNKLKGNMFNYWTEGGFIAWGQEPDPNTGHTPLKLFMDGRAQAAYGRPAFDLWTEIMSAGPIVQVARVRGQELKSDDYRQVGKWIHAHLKEKDAWVVLMPATEYNDRRKSGYHFVRALEFDPNWAVVFVNDRQKILVDMTTPQAQKLYTGIFTDTTLFPDEFCKNFTTGYNLIRNPDGELKKRGLDLIIQACKLDPSPAAMMEIIIVAPRFPELRPEVERFCKSYFDDFKQNMRRYAKKDGYRRRVDAARLACIHLGKMASSRRETEAARAYADAGRQYSAILGQLGRDKRW